MSERRVVALLGQRDEPTDAVEEYCGYLSGALHDRGVVMKLMRVHWAQRGWREALRELRANAGAWRDQWVFVQYTALAWSARGFPFRSVRVIKVLRNAGARVGVVYHDVEPYTGARVIDMMRRRAQLHVMRRVLKDADLAIFTVPLDVISWLGNSALKAVFIPVGANLPAVVNAGSKPGQQEPGPLRVAVFGITEGETGRNECRQIVNALRFATTRGGPLRLHAFGRGAREVEAYLRDALKGMPVNVCVEGVLSAEQVVRALTASDVALFVRGAISSRRGSAIAAIACGLPVLAYASSETAPPITDAGVVLVPREKEAELGEALLRVISDAELRASLAERSRQAQKDHFGWPAIAEHYVDALNRHVEI